MASPDDMASAMKEHSVADFIRDIGYAFTASIEDCKTHLVNFGARDLTAADVSRIISMMIKHRPNSHDLHQLHTPGNFWMNLEKKDPKPHGISEWNAEVFVQSLKELVSNLNWKEVILQLDHQEFVVPDRAALNLLFTILWLGLHSAGYPINVFPVEYLCRRWTNLEGQMSLISNILKYPDIFSFADHPFHQVSIDLLKSLPEIDNKEVGTWRSLYLVELLLYASEHGYYVLVTELFKTPLQHCPDILFLVLLQINPPLTPVRQELLTTLIPIFLGNHPNSGIILHRAWHTQNLNVKSIIMHAMADCYLRSECDQSKLSRILDIAQDLKALSLFLNMQSFPFAIDLACLASRREYLKLDKWLMDKIRDHGETFIAAIIKFLQRRCSNIHTNKRPEEQLLKAAHLPHETIAMMLTCLQVCIPNVQPELQEAIYNVIANCQTLIMSKSRATRVLETPFDTASLGAHLFTQHVDPIAALTPNVASMSLGPSSSTGTFGALVTNPGSPPRLMGAGTNSPFSMMPIQHNPRVANMGVLAGMVPASSLEKPRLPDPLHHPGITNKVPKEIEDEANIYFQRIYNHPSHPSLSIDEVLDLLKKFQDSPIKRERDIFACMLQNLVEEYKFFPQYPDKELHITAQFFGGIIEKNLVPSYVSLGLALRFVLDALKKGEGTKMYYFGIAALDRFKSRLKQYQKYCEHVRAIPYFNKFPSDLIEFVEYGLQGRDPPTKPQGPILPATFAAMLNQNPMVTATAPYRSLVCAPSTSVMTEMNITAVSSRPSIANVTNIDTLLTGTQDSEKTTPPPEAIQDKTAFIFNNLSQLNLQLKCEELRDIITEEYFPWLSRYLVMKRASIEVNFHGLYSNFLDVFKVRELNKMVTKETYRNIRVLLRSDKGIANFTDRSLLKNFGHWLGMLTLARNVPILDVDIDLKALLLEAYHKGRQELLYIVPFVAKVLESCAKSVVFKPPNPWTMALMNVLAELHQEPNLELNLKFEVEVLCKNLSLNVTDLKAVVYLRDPDKVKTIKFQLSSQPLKQQQNAAVAVAMPVNQAIMHQLQMMPPPTQMMQREQPTQMMQRDQPTQMMQREQPTQMMQREQPTPNILVPNDPALMSVIGHPLPRFSFLDINVSSNSISQNICIHPHITLFQNYPNLKQFVKPAIERSIQEWIHPVVDRAIKYALTTCEQIIRKDFSLDPDEVRMRTCAHHMMRNLTAGMAMITCREQIIGTISTNLKGAFATALMPASAHQDAIEEAVRTIATENMELACAFIQKTAVEKALPELDKRLMSDFEIRKQARDEGRRFYDPIQLAYQNEMIPQCLRPRVGGPSPLQMSVYEEFACNIPGFLPVRDAALFTPKPPAQEVQMPQQLPYGQVMDPTQVYSDGISALISAADVFLTNCLGNGLLAMLAGNMHALLECMCMARRNRDIGSACTLLQKTIEGLLDVTQPAASADPLEMMARYRDIHLRVLKLLEDSRVYGHAWTSKQVTCCLTDIREEIRYNIQAFDLLIRNRLVNVPQYDISLARMMDNGNNYMAVAFAMQLVRIYLADDRNNLVTSTELSHTTEVLARIMSHQPPPEGLGPLIETVRASLDPHAGFDPKSVLGPTALIHAGIMHVRCSNYEDPPGLKEKTENFLREWSILVRSPLSELDLQSNFNLYMHRMKMSVIFESEIMTTRFLRLASRMVIDTVYQLLKDEELNPTPGPNSRNKHYAVCDSFVKLVTLLIKNTDGGNPIPKLNILNKVLGIIVGWILHDHKVLTTNFQQLPYHRILIILFYDMNMPEPMLESMNFQILSAFCHTLHIANPAAASAFCYAWLEILSNRIFIERVLAVTPQQKCWGMYSLLLTDLFKYMEPFIWSSEVTLPPPVMSLYNGTLKVLLVLLHDFPEFLCDYHFGFCDVITPCCIQMRNLILSAFPRNMRLPDPFTPDLKVDLLEGIEMSPRSVVEYSTLLSDMKLKTDLDAYLKERAPVTFLSALNSSMESDSVAGRRYDVKLMNAVVLYVGAHAIETSASKGHSPTMANVTHTSHMDIFQNFAVDFDYEGRYYFLNAIANQLRYPNSHTHYFSCVLLNLFAEANNEAIQVQITRVLLERLIVNRPHPWGLLITFIELIKNPTYKFWQNDFVNTSPNGENGDGRLPPLYNYIVDMVISRISGRRDRTQDAEKLASAQLTQTQNESK